MEPLIPDGYIMLARKIRKSPLWLSLKATHRVIMLEILLQAQFKDGEVVRNGEIIFLKRGQVATSYQMLVDDIADKDVTVKVVRNAIEKLVKHDFLAKDEAKARAKKGLLLTVVKYEDYQNPDNYKGKAEGKEEGITRAKQGQSEGKARAINNNVNNGDKDKKVKNEKQQQESVVSENIFHFYQNNFGPINPFVSENVGKWIDETNEPLVLEAMKRALKQQKKWNYAEGILKRWVNEGIKDVNNIPVSIGSHKIQNHVPDWIKQPSEEPLDPKTEEQNQAWLESLLKGD